MTSIILAMVFFAIFGAFVAGCSNINGKSLTKKWIVIVAIIFSCIGGLWKYNQNYSYFENDACKGLGISRWC